MFVDGSQLVGALPVAGDLDAIDVLATADHKFLMHAGRGLGYCYLAPAVQERFVPVNAGWKAGRVPVESFFGPAMDLSPTASRFDNSISWVAAIGNEAALATFDDLGAGGGLRRATASWPKPLRAALDRHRARDRSICRPRTGRRSSRFRSATPTVRNSSSTSGNGAS